MDKIAIISDIHGNLPALQTVLGDIRRRRIKRVICLGDLAGKGPSPAETVDLIRQTSEIVVQGNWDLGITCRQEKAGGLWQQEALGEARLDYLEKLPFSHDLRISGKLLRLFHASSTSVFHRVKRKASKSERMQLFANTPAISAPEGHPCPDLVGYGDIHVPYLLTMRNPWDKPAKTRNESSTGKMLFNVGSVGVPYDGIPQACYCIIEGILDSELPAVLSIQTIRVPYDIEKAVQLARDSGMPENEADRYALEIRTAQVHK